MDKQNLHPVDDYFISKVNEGNKNASYNKANWDQLAARLDKHSVKPTPTGKINFLVKNIYILSLFIFTLIVVPSILYLSKDIPNVAHIEKIDHPNSIEESSLDDVTTTIESRTIIVETEEILLKKESASKPQQEQIAPIPIAPTETEVAVENIVELPEKSVETTQIEEKILSKAYAPKPVTPMKIVKFSLPPVSDDKEIQVESPKDSLFIFW